MTVEKKDELVIFDDLQKKAQQVVANPQEGLGRLSQDEVLHLMSGLLDRVTELENQNVKFHQGFKSHELGSLARFPSENRNPVMRISHDGLLLYANEASTPILTCWDSQVGQCIPDSWCQLMTDVMKDAESHSTEIICDGRIYTLDIIPIVNAGYLNIYGKDETERKKAEAQLEEQNAFINTVFESLRDPLLVIDINDYTIKMSNSAAKLDDSSAVVTCYSVSHLQKKPCAQLGNPCPLEEVKTTKKPAIVEHLHVDKASNQRFVEVHAHPIFDQQGDVIQIIEHLIDITDRKQMELALRESESKWRSLTQDAPDHIVMLDPDLKIQFLNYASPGLTQDELIGVPIWKLVSEEKQSEIKGILERVLKTGEPDHYETKYFTPDGKTIHYESRVVPLKVQENLKGLVLSARDITIRKQMEEVLRERTHTLGERVKELNCLYSISALVEKRDVSLLESLQGTVELIPPAWQYPEITEACIILEGQEYKTDNYWKDSPWKMAADIVVHGQPEGLVEVCYLEPKPDSDQGTFLKEERSLINAIAGRLSRMVERVRAEEALQKAHDELELRVQERTTELEKANQALQIEIFERKRAYEAEQNARQAAEVLRAASHELSHSLDPDMVVSTLLDYLVRLTTCDKATFALLGDESSLIVRGVRDSSGEYESERIPSENYNFADNAHIQQILKTGRSIFISDTRKHPNWKPYLKQEVVNWMGVPLFTEEKVIGLCFLEKGEPGFFKQEHLHRVETLVSQATVAIQNAWLFEQVHAGRERLQSLSRRLVESQESERRFIARELHDEAGQALTSLKVGLRLLERDAEAHKDIRAGVAELTHLSDEILNNLHRLAMDLIPASLDQLGLVAALRQHISSVSDKHNLMAQFENVGIDGRLPLEIETAFFRIVQEATTNVVRHSQANRLDVILEQRNDSLLLIVEDNGVGFNPEEAFRSENLGIAGIKERVEMLGGELQVESNVGSGTTIYVEVPYDPANTHCG